MSSSFRNVVPDGAFRRQEWVVRRIRCLEERTRRFGLDGFNGPRFGSIRIVWPADAHQAASFALLVEQVAELRNPRT